eukprot:7078476-Lingulodinium_polyedra.AAC.1
MAANTLRGVAWRALSRSVAPRRAAYWRPSGFEYGGVGPPLFCRRSKRAPRRRPFICSGWAMRRRCGAV